MGRIAAIALAATALAAVPMMGAAAAEKSRPPAISLSFDRISNFTPASGDPRLAALFASKDNPASDFKFTPAAAPGRPSQVRVAIRGSAITSRPVESSDASGTPRLTALTPEKYDLGVSVGWRRLAVSGDVGRTSSPDPIIGTRETAVVGVSYNLKKFTGRIAVAGERNDSRVAQLARPDAMSVDVGASYNVSRNIALTGGVRYRIERDQIPALAEDRRDSRGVYVGTSFRF